MSLELHPFQYIPLFLFGLYCLKRLVDSNKFYEFKLVFFIAALTLLVLILFFWAINYVLGDGIVCTPSNDPQQFSCPEI